MSLARRSGAIPLHVAHLPVTLLHRSNADGRLSPIVPIAAGITDSGHVAIVEASSTALSIFGSNGQLAQQTDSVRNPTAPPGAALVSGPWSEIFVRTETRGIALFAFRAARYQQFPNVPAALDLTAMCYLNGWLVLAGWDSAGTHAIHVVDRRSGKLVRAIQTIEPGESSATRNEAQQERLACDSGTDMIYLVSSGTNVTLGAFSLPGHRLWQRRIVDVPPNADPHPSSLVAVYGRGVLLQFRLAVPDTTSTQVVRNHVTAFFEARDGTAIVDRNLWARAVAVRGNRMLWASDGAADVLPGTFLSWIVP